MFLTMAAAERASRPTTMEPGSKTWGSVCPFLDQTGAASCLQRMIDARKPLLRAELLSHYRSYFLIDHADGENRVWINQTMTGFMRDEPLLPWASSDEMNIDSSNLARLLPLAWRFSRHMAIDGKTISARYELIHQLTTLSVGHRRASLGAGLLISAATEIIKSRRKYGRPLTTRRLVNALRKGIQAALSFYHSSSEYRGEAGHYALLQTNRLGRLHLEEVPERELHASHYVVDTVILTLWLMIHVKNKTEYYRRLEAIRSPEVGACSGGLLGLAYGSRYIKKDPSRNLDLD